MLIHVCTYVYIYIYICMYKYKKVMHTSIFLPSTTVPCSLSRARSASALFANVTKPNPCMQGQTKQHALNSTYRLLRSTCTSTSTSFYPFFLLHSLFQNFTPTILVELRFTFLHNSLSLTVN